MGGKFGAVPLFGVAGSPCNNVAWTEAYLRTKWHLDPSSCLATIDMGQTMRVLCPYLGGAGSPSNTIAWAEAYLRTKWYPDAYSRLATIDMGRKLG